jgi:hypothetical protein
MPSPRRRWFAFRLRTLFVVVTVFALPLAWVAYSLNWIRQRHAAMALSSIRVSPMPRLSISAPWQLRPFGEGGVAYYSYRSNCPLNDSDLKALFPEAVGRYKLGPNVSDNYWRESNQSRP